MEVDRNLQRLSVWIDDANHASGIEAQTWGRVAKITEEAGEAIAALIGVTGQNPRKGVTHDWADVQKELLDVATTALAAWVHVRDRLWAKTDEVPEQPTEALSAHVDSLVERAGLNDLVPGASGSLASERKWFCATYDGKMIEGLPDTHSASVNGRIVESTIGHYTTCGWFDVDKAK